MRWIENIIHLLFKKKRDQKKIDKKDEYRESIEKQLEERLNRGKRRGQYYKKRKEYNKDKYPYNKNVQRNKIKNNEPSYDFTKSKFHELDIDKKLLEVVFSKNIYDPSEVQYRAIPIALQEKNLLCVSQTGSGKTLAFLLPILHKIINGLSHQALVICPTREIAFQINEVVSDFSKNDKRINSVLVIGGEDFQKQKDELRNYPSVIIATPGRMVDMIKNGNVWLNYTEMVVFDEADRMLDMGFEKELIVIMNEVTHRKQLLLYTATLIGGIKKLIGNYMDSYEEVIVGSKTKASDNIDHFVVKIRNMREKEDYLKKLLKETEGKIIVFFNKIEEVKKQYREYNSIIRGIDSLHSGKKQEDRKSVVDKFQNGSKRILFATDIISRGLDVPNVELIVNYDLPQQPEEYIHRIGRTGRAGLYGRAISLYMNRDFNRLVEIEKLLGKKIKNIEKSNTAKR